MRRDILSGGRSSSEILYITRTFPSYNPAHPARGDTRTRRAAREREPRPLKRPVSARVGSEVAVHTRDLSFGPASSCASSDDASSVSGLLRG